MDLEGVKYQCGSCEKIDTYVNTHDKGCSSCGSKSLWRVYTDAEIDQMREGEKVE